MCHIFVEHVMITLVTFYAPGCFLALKRLCEWLLDMSDYFNNHLILCYFKVSKKNFFRRLSIHMPDTKVLQT